MCAACQRAQAACICRWVAPSRSEVRLLILQSTLEARNAKNSARLLHLSLQGSVLALGDAFDTTVLDAMLHADGALPVLLYPSAQHAGMAVAPPLPVELKGPVRLVALDATWRKSLRMLYENPALQRLPRLSLNSLDASRYAPLRKAHKPGQLSTFEAVCTALAQLDAAFDPGALLAGFGGFVAQQTRLRESHRS
ncbi:MAG TPA: tRNA-uridine aminocarboxypropyltransferase [Burkholderiaceae bacterium]